MVKPSRRREMAQQVVVQGRCSVRMACEVYAISQTCYRYQAKLSDENAQIADWLIRLARQNSDWGFGLCFDDVRNVEGFGWNHKTR